MHIPEEQIATLRVQGMSFREIAEVTGFGYGSVRRVYHGERKVLSGEKQINRDFQSA